MDGGQYRRVRPKKMTVSADRRFILMKLTNVQIWRRSSFGIYRLAEKSGNSYTFSEASLFPDPGEPQELRYVSWSPNNNGLVYVDRNNDLYYRHQEHWLQYGAAVFDFGFAV